MRGTHRPTDLGPVRKIPGGPPLLTERVNWTIRTGLFELEDNQGDKLAQGMSNNKKSKPPKSAKNGSESATSGDNSPGTQESLLALGDVPAERKTISIKSYERNLRRLQVELVKMQEWVRANGERLLIIFEGRDAAGKGGTIKRIAERLNPRVCRIVALGTPTEREQGQWYFQRYVEQLPSAGEIVLMDRSWYNRAGVERVMGFCNEEQYLDFLISCPELERLLIRSGMTMLKYWFSISAEEQERRFRKRLADPTKHWKLSKMDLESRLRWNDYSQAKDIMMQHTDTKHAPWFVVEADNKRRARLNCISHILNMIPYEDVANTPEGLPDRPEETPVGRTPKTERNYVPEAF